MLFDVRLILFSGDRDVLTQRGEGILGGALLGLLVGGLLSTSAQSTTAVRKVFAMELDPATRTWLAYDGTLLRWMKDRLLPPQTEASRW